MSAIGNIREPDAGFLALLGELLGEAGVVRPEDGAGYLTELRGQARGRAALIVRPADVGQTAEILRRCNDALVAVVPYAGGTGLVGGQVMLDGPAPVVLSVERMRAVREINVEDDVMIAEAGCVLADLQAAAAQAGRLFPLSLAAEGSCRIGGNLATNAGGVSAIRFGSARDLCLGIEAALPNGQVLHGLRRLRKDNTGFDLRHLLIGSEGALGVITAASLKLYPRPAALETAYLAVESPQAALRLLRALQAEFGDSVFAFELISDVGVGFVLEHVAGARAPLDPRPAWSALVEIGGRRLREPLLAALSKALEDGLISDAAIAESAQQRDDFWRLREEIPSANRQVGAIASHDVSAPLSRIGAVIRDCDAAVARIEPSLRINCFGHLGDGNLHYNVFPPAGGRAAEFRALADRLSEAIYGIIDRHDGSISAEHGVGRFKREIFGRLGDPAKIQAMRAIKAALDPHGIMNPGAVIPEENA